MASAASLASPSGHSPSSPQTSTATQNNGVPRPTMRSSSAAKTGDVGRKQSPSNGAARRIPSQKAWTSGTNPLTQRGSTPTQSNGVATLPKPSSTTKMNVPKEGGLSDRHAHDRLMFILGAAMGLSILVKTKTGEKYEGILAGSVLSPANAKISLKMTKKVQATGGAGSVTAHREAALIGSSPDHAMNFDLRDMADVSIPEFSVPEPTKMTNGTSSKFQTDVDISGNQSRGEKPLQRWVPDGPDNTDFSLESTTHGEWDQFATNRQLFGAQSTYDENYYTTAIDRTAASYKVREANAARIAKEIEGSASTNSHMREERGQIAENEAEDEEDKYSGVRRGDSLIAPLPAGGQNKYTPPARRPPTGQPTVAGAPVDSAIVSAQLSRADVPKAMVPRMEKDASLAEVKRDTPSPETPATDKLTSSELVDQASRERSPNASVSPQLTTATEGQTEGVEAKVLQQFRVFADTEKAKLMEKRRAQASHDRTAKLNELMRFSKTFKLKTPIPTDLVGILAKDPVKQEAIIEKAQKEHDESTSVTASPSSSSVSGGPRAKVELPQMAAIPERQSFNRGRGGLPQAGTRQDRNAQQQPLFPGRNTSFPQRPAGAQPDRKVTQPPSVPAPIPIHDGRMPPTGPMADQVGLGSPQRSNLQTPTSAASAKFNLNVKASEFRPNAAAPAFNPVASSNAPSSPASVQRTISGSRAASPSMFFGSRKPKTPSERPSLSAAFNPIKKMKNEVAARKTAGDKNAKPEEGQKDAKDYSANGGIPNSFQTGPRWIVRVENSDRTYLQAFDRPLAPVASPIPSRSGSAHHVPYQNQLPHPPTGPANVPQISTPQHMPQGVAHSFAHQYDDGHQRMQMQAGSPQVYPSPSIQSRQMSAYASPMGPHAQLAYTQQPYFGAGGGQMALQMRQYPGTAGMMHGQTNQMGAPMMVQQQSNGPYMQIPQQYNPQMQMYSPNPQHVYPQQNGGYGSPSRAPMMMQQGSQQGHHPGQPMMYTMSAQSGPMGYGQQGQMGMVRGGYGNPQFGSSPHQPYPMQQRAMSSGYGQIPQKGMGQQMVGTPGAPMNAAQQSAPYAQLEIAQEEGK